ncbi:MAG: 16S rRNA (adenine(1518)-N(6)/adenine(1519)-N(6))-dimethyltransferase RsmA [Gemmatimonadota bacterium]
MPVRKRFGQHFLTDQSTLRRIVAALDPQPGETVVEIGPGRGALTELLIKSAAQVTAIEIDRDLVEVLQRRYAGEPGLKVVAADVLKVDLHVLGGKQWTLVGNVPYYITTPLIFRALEAPRPRRAVFLVQKEVAERVSSLPGADPYGALTVNVALVARASIVATVGAGAFTPRPRVDSAVLAIDPLPIPLCEPGEEEPLRKLVVSLFGQRRRQMTRALRTAAGLDAARSLQVLNAAAVDPIDRAENLEPAAFVRIFRALGVEVGRG